MSDYGHDEAMWGDTAPAFDNEFENRPDTYRRTREADTPAPDTRDAEYDEAMPEAYSVGFDEGSRCGDETCFTLFHDGAQQVVAFGATARILHDAFVQRDSLRARLAESEAVAEVLAGEHQARSYLGAQNPHPDAHEHAWTADVWLAYARKVVAERGA